MLNAFSWQDFLLAATLLSLIWWLGIWLVYYRNTVTGNLSSLPHSWSDEVDELEVASGLMGAPVLEPGERNLRAEDFSFGVSAAGEGATGPGELLGDLADVQEEINSICGILAVEDGTKEDFFLLFEMIRRKYPKIASSASLASLNVFIREHVPFALSEEELENLWV